MRTALLSQEGSTIETAVEIVRGVVPEPQSLRLHSETICLENHPSRHRKERDDAALLTQEGNSSSARNLLAGNRELDSFEIRFQLRTFHVLADNQRQFGFRRIDDGRNGVDRFFHPMNFRLKRFIGDDARA